MDMFGVAAVAICGVLLVALLKKVNPSQGILLGLLTVVLIFLFVLEKSAPLVEQLSGMMENELIDNGYISILLKSAGVTIIGQLTSNLCKDCGESALGYSVEFAAKIAVLLLAMPIITDIVSLLREILMQGR